MIKIICFGKIKEPYLQDAINDYQKRIQKYIKLSILQLKDEKDTNPKTALKKEKETLIKHIKPGDNIVLLDIKGAQFTSIDFAKYINKELSHNNNITFIIGSSNGLDEEIKKLTSKTVSFSPLTFPHGIFRLLLLEQIYRSFKILSNESYHK